MTTLLLPLASLRSIIPPTVLFGVMPHYFCLNTATQILRVFLPATTYQTIYHYLFHNYQSLVTYFFACFSGTQIYFYGDRIDTNKKENVLYMSNHQSAIDWSIVNFVGISQNSMGQIRFVIKDLLRYLPLYGMTLMQHGCIFVKTKGGKNVENDIRRKLQNFKRKHQNGYWLALFPEGTRFNSSKLELIKKSSCMARNAGLSPFDNVLFPKTKGIELCLEQLTNLDAIYDITIAFKIPWIPVKAKHEGPSLMEFVSVFGREVHINFRRIPIEEVPNNVEDVQKWVYDRFKEKDRLLHHFYDPCAHGTFPGDSYSIPLNSFKLTTHAVLNTVLLVATLSFKSSRDLYYRISLFGITCSVLTPLLQKLWI